MILLLGHFESLLMVQLQKAEKLYIEINIEGISGIIVQKLHSNLQKRRKLLLIFLTS